MPRHVTPLRTFVIIYYLQKILENIRPFEGMIHLRVELDSE